MNYFLKMQWQASIHGGAWKFQLFSFYLLAVIVHIRNLADVLLSHKNNYLSLLQEKGEYLSIYLLSCLKYPNYSFALSILLSWWSKWCIFSIWIFPMLAMQFPTASSQRNWCVMALTRGLWDGWDPGSWAPRWSWSTAPFQSGNLSQGVDPREQCWAQSCWLSS